MSNIIPFQEIQTMATSVAKSGMFNIKSIEQATTLMLIAQAEGIAPVQAVQMYSVINGMPSLKSTEVQARFQRAGGKVNWKETTTEKATVELSIDGQSYVSEFTMEDSKRMGLASKDNWKKMPKQMCMARAIAMGVRAIYPACLNNMYSVDEMNDTVSSNDYVDVELETIEQPKNEMNVLKLKLSNKMRDMYGIKGADLKDFAEKFDLANDEELLLEVINNDEKLSEMVVEFEGTI